MNEDQHIQKRNDSTTDKQNISLHREDMNKLWKLEIFKELLTLERPRGAGEGGQMDTP